MSYEKDLEKKSIRELREIAKQHGITNYSRKTKALLVDAIVKASEEDIHEANEEVDKDERLAAGDYTDEELDARQAAENRRRNLTDEDAHKNIVAAALAQDRAEERLAKIREEQNKAVKDAKASFTGAIEASVDYDDPSDTSKKLKRVTSRFQDWEEAKDGRTEALKAPKEDAAKAKKAFREAVKNANQLNLGI